MCTQRDRENVEQAGGDDWSGSDGVEDWVESKQSVLTLRSQNIIFDWIFVCHCCCCCDPIPFSVDSLSFYTFSMLILLLFFSFVCFCSLHSLTHPLHHHIFCFPFVFIHKYGTLHKLYPPLTQPHTHFRKSGCL